MIRKRISSTVLLLILLDQLVLVGSLSAALWFKKHAILADPLLPVGLHVNLFLRLWPFLAISLILSGAYNLHMAVGGLRPLLHRTAISAVVLAGVWIGGTFYLKITVLHGYSRGVFTLFLGFSAIGLVLLRIALAEVTSLWRARTGRERRVLVFGGETLGRDLIADLQDQVFVPVGIVQATGRVDMPGVIRLDEDEALRKIRQGEVDHIIIDLPPRRIRLLLQVAQLAEREGVPIQITPTIFPGLHLSPRVDHVGDIPVIELTSGDLPLAGILAKRTFDLVGAAIGLLLCSPLFLVVASLIKLTSRGPVFYRQERVGLSGRRFHMFKFRTMHVDAERETGPVWAVDDDPRATTIGRFLRRTNLDELPQLFNVLVGTMSLIGPRPERPEFVDQFKPLIDRYSHKHWVRPGMTGWAQVNGWRGRTDLNRRIQHDIHYVEQWSLALDLKITALTSVLLARIIWGTLVRQFRPAKPNRQEVTLSVAGPEADQERSPSPHEPAVADSSPAGPPAPESQTEEQDTPSTPRHADLPTC